MLVDFLTMAPDISLNLKRTKNNSVRGGLIFTISVDGTPVGKDHFEIDIDDFERLWKRHPIV